MHYFGKPSTFAAAAASAILMLGGLSACDKRESAASLLSEAKQFQAKGDNTSAIIQLKNAVLKNPDDAQARLLLGTLYGENGDPVSAEKELRKARSLGADKNAVLPELALALQAQQQFQKVVDETEAAGDSKDPRVLTSRGDALLALGKTDLAKACFDAALALKPDHIGAIIGQARVALARKDLPGALAVADDAVAKNPNSADAWMFKGDLMRSAGKRTEALAAYDKALVIAPRQRGAHIEKASIEIGAGNYDAAKLDIDAARKLAPNSVAVDYAQALLDFSQSNHEAARESLQKILRVAPDYMPAVLMAGANELALGATAQAEQHLKKYLEIFPDSGYARKLMVATLLQLGRSGDALAALSPALRGNGAKDPQLLALAGEIQLQTGDFGKANDYFQQASAITPDAASLHTAIAQTRLAQGDAERAVAELEQATKLNATSTKAGILLVLTELRLKHMDKALAAVKQLELQQPKSATVKNLKGGVYLNQGDLVNARASFEAALALEPTFFPAVSNLARLAVKEKHPDEAKQRLLAFVAKQPKNIEALSALATLAAEQGQMAEATTWLEKAAAENPEAVAPSLTLISQYLRVGDKQKALTLARKAQVAHPEVPELLDLLGQAQMAGGDGAAALDSFSKLAAMAPRSPAAQFRLGLVHLRMNNDAAAADDLKRAVALQADFLDAQLAQVQLAMMAGKGEAALAIVHQIQKQRPKESIAYSVEGDILLALKKPAPAGAAYEKAYGLSKSAPLVIKIHSLAPQTGHQKEADAQLAAYQREHPADMAVALYIAESNMAAKQYDLAAKQLADIVKVEPNNVGALNNLAWLYDQKSDARALPMAEQALKLAPGSPAILDTLGTILIGQGNTTRGLPMLQQAVSAFPQNADFRFHLATGLVKAGDKAGARKELDKLLADNKDFVKINDVRALLKTL